MDEDKLFEIVRNAYNGVNTDYLKSQVLAAVAEIGLTRQEVMNGLLDWIVVGGCTGVNDRYRRYIYGALALLREQEARVMALEEARATLHTADFLYCEDKNDDTMAGGLMRGVLNGSDYWDLINGEYMTPDCLDEGEDLEAEYGKTFRFWTSRPTPEQMRDTPWEGEDNG